MYKQAKQDTSTYATSRTGFAITNQLDHGDLNKVDADTSNDVVYLTRSDWAGTMPKAELSGKSYKAAVQIAANDELVKSLNTVIDSTREGTMPTMEKEGELTLAHFIGVPLDGSITLQDGKTYTWDDLLDQVKFNEMAKLIGQTYHATAAMKSVGKPATKDENGSERYNIVYFFHGTNELQDSFIGLEKVKNAIDNMIEVGVVEPFIMVCPTYYYDYENRAIDMTAFSTDEMRNDIMPAVESAYRTYAETADEAGFIASREHRAFGGFSRGCYACWHQFFNSLDYAKWFMPFSANISAADEMSLEMPVEEQLQMVKDALAAQSEYKDDFFIFAACGGKRDMMYDVNNALMAAVIRFRT